MELSQRLKLAIAEYKNGNVEAFTPLYEESSKYIYACVYKVLRGNDNAALIFMMIFGGSSPSEVFLPNRYDLSTKRPRTHRKRSCLQRYEAAKSVCYSALPRKWEQAQMSKTALSPFTIWIVRGDPLTLNKDRGVSKGKAICS